jgi:hypothetical protein
LELEISGYVQDQRPGKSGQVAVPQMGFLAGGGRLRRRIAPRRIDGLRHQAWLCGGKTSVWHLFGSDARPADPKRPTDQHQQDAQRAEDEPNDNRSF